MEKANERRRNFYIKKKFQRNFIIKFCALVTAGSIISGAIIYLMSRATVTTTFENSKLVIKSTADFILPAVLLASAVVIIVIGLATIIVTLFASHKIAGPLYRLEKDMDEVIAGNLKIQFNLRHADEIKPLATSLNIMVGALRGRMASIKNIFSELEAGINAPGNSLSGENKNKLMRIKNELAKFDV